MHEIDLREIFECTHLKFTVYGRKQASTYVNTLPQCSLASVGLAQARPNNYRLEIIKHIQELAKILHVFVRSRHFVLVGGSW